MPRRTRRTRQKGLIKKEIDCCNSFFTAEELLERIRKTDSKIGLATIYRLLKDMREQRELHSYLCNRKTIYSRDKKSHSHFICQRCNKIIHFDVDSIDFLKKKIQGNICHFQLDVTGVCEECVGSEKYK